MQYQRERQARLVQMVGEQPDKIGVLLPGGCDVAIQAKAFKIKRDAGKSPPLASETICCTACCRRAGSDSSRVSSPVPSVAKTIR